jgi:hypothetical protein
MSILDEDVKVEKVTMEDFNSILKQIDESSNSSLPEPVKVIIDRVGKRINQAEASKETSLGILVDKLYNVTCNYYGVNPKEEHLFDEYQAGKLKYRFGKKDNTYIAFNTDNFKRRAL